MLRKRIKKISLSLITIMMILVGLGFINPVRATGSDYIKVTKTADQTEFLSVGEIITYNYVVQNTGTEGYRLTAIELTDDKIDTINIQIPVSLYEGESITGTAEYEVTQADMDAGFVTNVAKVTAGYGEIFPLSAEDTDTITINKGDISVETGTVEVTYVDTNRNIISQKNVLTGAKHEGYTADQLDIVGYKFVEVEGDATGQFTDGVQFVEFVYEEVLGKVQVTYKDIFGVEISPMIILEGRVGTQYTSEQLDIFGYEFFIQSIPDGSYEEEIIYTNYMYQTVSGRVEVTYVNTDGDRIASPVRLDGQQGKDYAAVQLDILGYNFVEVEGNEIGQFTDGTILVKFIYEKITRTEKGLVKVTYEDTGGNEIDTLTLDGQVGESWSSQEKDFGVDYLFKEVIGETSGTFTGEAQEVTYVYYKSIPATEIEDTATTKIPATEIEDTATTKIPVTEIEDIATTKIPATEVEDIATTKIPATEIEDTATTKIPATEIEDIATMVDTKKETNKDGKLPSTGMSNTFSIMSVITLGAGVVLKALSKKKED